MSVINVTADNIEQVKNSDKKVLLDFYATWCGPCKMLSPIIDQIGEEHPEYLVGKVEVDTQTDLAGEFDVMSVPTLLILDKGVILEKVTGIRPKEKILELLEG